MIVWVRMAGGQGAREGDGAWRMEGKRWDGRPAGGEKGRLVSDAPATRARQVAAGPHLKEVPAVGPEEGSLHGDDCRARGALTKGDAWLNQTRKRV